MVVQIGLFLLSYFTAYVPIRARSSDGIVIIIGVALLGVYRYANRFDMSVVIVVHRNSLWCDVVCHALIITTYRLRSIVWNSNSERFS